MGEKCQNKTQGCRRKGSGWAGKGQRLYYSLVTVPVHSHQPPALQLAPGWAFCKLVHTLTQGVKGSCPPWTKEEMAWRGQIACPRGEKTSLPAVCPTMGRTLSRGRPRIRARGRQGKDGLRVYLPKEETRVVTGDDR